MTKYTDIFDELCYLHENVARGIYSYGYEKPSKIQQWLIENALHHPTANIIVQAQSGTGKTSAYLIPIITRIDKECTDAQVLIIVPTYILAVQIDFICRAHCDFEPSIHTAVVHDASYKHDSAQIVIATADIAAHLEINKVHTLVIDEANTVLSGDTKHVDSIISKLASSAQRYIVSTTLTSSALAKANEIAPHALMYVQEKTDLLACNVTHQIIYTRYKENNFDVLCDLLELHRDYGFIIFCNSTAAAQDVYEQLNMKIGSLCEKLGGLILLCDHDDVASMKAFKQHHKYVLVTTDVYRGIDTYYVQYVFNYEMPINAEDYVHRSGNAGPFGRNGCTVNLCTLEDRYVEFRLERDWKVSFQKRSTDVSDAMLNSTYKGLAKMVCNNKLSDIMIIFTF
jgi:superfamily II DNA/RNA helicase